MIGDEMNKKQYIFVAILFINYLLINMYIRGEVAACNPQVLGLNTVKVTSGDRMCIQP